MREKERATIFLCGVNRENFSSDVFFSLFSSYSFAVFLNTISP